MEPFYGKDIRAFFYHQQQQYSIQDRMIDLYISRTASEKKKLHTTNQGSNFLGASFNSRDNVTALI